MKFMDEVERLRRMRLLLDRVTARHAQPVDSPAASKTAELTPPAGNVLIKSALEPGTPLTSIYAALQLHAAEGKRAVDELLAAGYVRMHRIARKGRGGQPTVLEVLRAGMQELSKRGVAPAPRLIARGGFLHDVYGRFIHRWLHAQGVTRIQCERTLGEKAFDLLYEDAQGLHGIEICLSGTAEWTAQQMLKAASVAGVVDVVMACEKQTFLKTANQKLEQIDALGLYRPKIKPALLADYVPDFSSPTTEAREG